MLNISLSLNSGYSKLLKHATLVYRVHLLQLHEGQLHSALTRERKPGCVKARDNEHQKLCDFFVSWDVCHFSSHSQKWRISAMFTRK